MVEDLNVAPLSWHCMEVDDIYRQLSASTDGLNQEEAHHRLTRLGPNRLRPARKKNILLRFLGHFHNVLIYILLAASLITAILGHWVDSGVILGVVFINAVIGFIQEGKAEKALDANLNIHLHCLFLDGVYRQVDGKTVFDLVRPPKEEQLQHLLHQIMQCLMKSLTKRGFLGEEDGMLGPTETDDKDFSLMPLHAASCTYRIALGPRAGQKVLTLKTVEPEDWHTPRIAVLATADLVYMPTPTVRRQTVINWNVYVDTLRAQHWLTSVSRSDKMAT